MMAYLMRVGSEKVLQVCKELEPLLDYAQEQYGVRLGNHQLQDVREYFSLVPDGKVGASIHVACEVTSVIVIISTV